MHEGTLNDLSVFSEEEKRVMLTAIGLALYKGNSSSSLFYKPDEKVAFHSRDFTGYNNLQSQLSAVYPNVSELLDKAEQNGIFPLTVKHSDVSPHVIDFLTKHGMPNETDIYSGYRAPIDISKYIIEVFSKMKAGQSTAEPEEKADNWWDAGATRGEVQEAFFQLEKERDPESYPQESYREWRREASRDMRTSFRDRMKRKVREKRKNITESAKGKDNPWTDIKEQLTEVIEKIKASENLDSFIDKYNKKFHSFTPSIGEARNFATRMGEGFAGTPAILRCKAGTTRVFDIDKGQGEDEVIAYFKNGYKIKDISFAESKVITKYLDSFIEYAVDGDVRFLAASGKIIIVDIET